MNTTIDTDDTADDLIDCPTCGGRGLAGRDPEDDEPCPTCLGDGAIEPGAEVCEAPESDTPHGLCDDDGEPGDIDNDAGYDPYTGGAEDDGYDRGTFDDGPCDDF